MLSDGQGTCIMLRRSIPGPFLILYYDSATAKLDVTLSKSSHFMNGQKVTVVTVYLKSDIANALRPEARVRLARPPTSEELLEIMTNLRDALLAWPGFTSNEDGPVANVIMSAEPVNWYQAEFEAERKTGSRAYWIGSTEMGLNIEKAIVEHIAAGKPFQISQEEQLWLAASKRFADEAKGDVRIVL
ncbi:hypothetical protein AA14337_2384 [Acetobacter malorum DSM 14337]|uniref:Uncharacterized protein n=2 Tax=Acetobacter malorum TaxID=178901 RepID=A0ABQ0PVF2_9PROT|nr:hypothetical protein AA14337_2384 [Acetobacter malorum DSM 14337]